MEAGDRAGAEVGLEPTRGASEKAPLSELPRSCLQASRRRWLRGLEATVGPRALQAGFGPRWAQLALLHPWWPAMRGTPEGGGRGLPMASLAVPYRERADR